MPLVIPVQQKAARKTLMTLFPKNGASHLLRGEFQVVRTGKRSLEWWWLKDKEGKSWQKQNKGRSEDQSEDLRVFYFRQNKQHSCVAQFTQSRPSSVQFSCSVVSDSLQPYESQHARPPCASQTPRVYSNSCPPSRWCHPAISSSVILFSSCPQSHPASGSFQMNQLFT